MRSKYDILRGRKQAARQHFRNNKQELLLDDAYCPSGGIRISPDNSKLTSVEKKIDDHQSRERSLLQWSRDLKNFLVVINLRSIRKLQRLRRVISPVLQMGCMEGAYSIWGEKSRRLCISVKKGKRGG
jgi:hypothetical protein